MALVTLEAVHPAVLEAVRRAVTGESSVASSAIRDFDAHEVVVSLEGDDAVNVVLSLHSAVPVAWFEQHCQATLQEVLKAKFGANLSDPEDGMLATVRVAVNPDEPEAVLKHSALINGTQLRAVCMTAPFIQSARKFLAGDSGCNLRVPYRAGESLYLYNNKGVFSAAVSLVVDDADDRLFMRNFLQDMADTRRSDKAAAGGPVFNLLAEAPLMPASLQPAEVGDNVLWCTFGFLNRHFENDAKAEATGRIMLDFRAYIFYHMQCGRSNLHAAMRSRVKSSLQVLNRAKTKTTGMARIQLK